MWGTAEQRAQVSYTRSQRKYELEPGPPEYILEQGGMEGNFEILRNGII